MYPTDHNMNPHHEDGSLVVAYVGTVVPDTSDFAGPAFSRAGNMFQENLLGAIDDCGLKVDLISAQRPMRLFPVAHARTSR
jgi:hypothetical protein